MLKPIKPNFSLENAISDDCLVFEEENIVIYTNKGYDLFLAYNKTIYELLTLDKIFKVTSDLNFSSDIVDKIIDFYFKCNI